MSRKRIFEIIEKSDGHDTLSAIYDYSMIVVIIISLIPLAFKQDTPLCTSQIINTQINEERCK